MILQITSTLTYHSLEIDQNGTFSWIIPLLSTDYGNRICLWINISNRLAYEFSGTGFVIPIILSQSDASHVFGWRGGNVGPFSSMTTDHWYLGAMFSAEYLHNAAACKPFEHTTANKMLSERKIVVKTGLQSCYLLCLTVPRYHCSCYKGWCISSTLWHKYTV